jgi:hypothetical protein
MKHVYIIEAGNGHKKIGVASDINKRLRSLKTGISTGIKSVSITDKVNNAYEIEKKLHKANDSIRLTGEWFDGDIDLCGYEFSNAKDSDYCGDYHYVNLIKLLEVISSNKVSGNASKLFLFFIEKIDKNNQVITDKAFKKSAAKIIKVSERTIDNLITNLIDARLLARRLQNIYIINKEFVTYGRKLTA